MSSAYPVEVYRWLTSAEAAPWFREAQPLVDRPLEMQRRLRQGLSVWQAQAIAQQLTLRERAKAKFSRAAEMLFTAKGLEQATDETLACYKSARFAQRRLVDVAAGVGGDLTGLCRAGDVVAVDADAVHAILARWNARVYGGRVASVRGLFGPWLLRRCDAWHADPDRRVTGRRTTHLEALQPPLEQLLEALVVVPNAAIKLAPAAPDGPWPAGSLREWVGHRGECQQQIVWTGDLAVGGGPRRATVLDAHGVAHQIDGHGSERLTMAREPGQLLLDPAPPVRAAGLTAALAQKLAVQGIGDGGAYLTGACGERSPLAAVFRVIETVRLQADLIRTALRRHSGYLVEVKKRGVPLDPNALQRSLQQAGERPLSLLVFPLRGRYCGVLAERLAGQGSPPDDPVSRAAPPD